MATAAHNPDGSIAVVIFNEGDTAKNFNLSLNEKTINIKISEESASNNFNTN